MINWKPFSPKAIDFIMNADARLNILDGSVRSSKTVNCSVKWLHYLADGPQGDLIMLGKTTATLQRNVLNDLFDIVGPKNYKWINKQQGELTFLGRRVYCFGANNEEAESKIRGATFAGAYCDEVSTYPRSVFNQLMARLSVKGARCFCNTNPDSPYHWFYTDYIQNPEMGDPRVMKRWRFTMDDNLSLDDEYVQSLKKYYSSSRVWYERMILGEWVAAEGRVYDMFEPTVHIIDTLAFLSNAKLHPNSIRWLVGCDYGTSTVMSWGLYGVLPNGVILKVKEYYYDAQLRQVQKTDSEFGAEFQRWLGPVVPESVYVDPSAASWKQELMRRGYRVLNADNDVINGIRYVGDMLSNKQYFIDNTCVNTKKEYTSYVWDENAQKKGLDKPLKQHDHACDTDRYVLYTFSLSGLAGVYGRGN